MTMLGAPCSPCCSTCACPGGEELPDFVTVTLSGLTKSSTRVENLLGLTISACYGSNATGTVSSKGGKSDEGFPIESVAVTFGGSGYAKLGRVAPTLTITGSGTGATFTPTLESKNDACGVPTWSIKSVSVSGGSGYQYGEQLSVTAAPGDTEIYSASLTLQTTRQQPTVTASASGGAGASLSVSISANGTTPETWGVSSVSVTNGGTGYPATGSVAFNKASGDTEEQAAYATFYSGRVAPTVTVAVGGSGSGAVLSGTLSSGTDYSGRAYWYISSISVTTGGSGYSEYDPASATVTDGVYGEYSSFYAVVSVDGGGVVTGVTVYDGGEFYKSNGIIASVEIDYYSKGSYYKEGPASAVDVNDGGQYYREDVSATPYVADITVAVTQVSPSHGTGADITATVEVNTSSPNFGKITGLTLEDGGDGYLAWTYADCDVTRLNGRAVTIARSVNNVCIYTRCLANGTITVEWRGSQTPPRVFLSTDCTITFTANEADGPFHCEDMSFTATEILGGTAVVVAGGSVPSCEQIWNASSLEVTITGGDGTIIRKAPGIGTALCMDGCTSGGKSAGSHYNGTFACTFLSENNYGNGVLRYFKYDLGEFCGHPSFVGVWIARGFLPQVPFGGGYNEFAMLVEVYGVTGYNMSNPLTQEVGQWNCGPPTGFSTRLRSDCNCDLEAIDHRVLFTGGGGGDGQSGGIQWQPAVIDGDVFLRIIKVEVGA